MGDSQRGTRETAQRFSRPVAPRPLSHGCRRASVSAAASVGRWATSHRDVAAPKGEPSLASPFGGRWCPVGTVQRLTEPAGESAPLWGAERVRRPPPRTCAGLLMSTSEASCHRRELPGVQPPRIDSGGTPPRIARGATPQALGLHSLPGVWYAKQNPREECLL